MSFEIGKSYNFETYASNLLGTNFKSVLISAKMDYNLAIKERDITGAHQQVLPYLPTGTVEDASKNTYIRVKLPTGEYTILSDAWIRQDTIQEVGSETIDIVVYGGSTELATRIRDMLALMNLTDFTVNIRSQPIIQN